MVLPTSLMWLLCLKVWKFFSKLREEKKQSSVLLVLYQFTYNLYNLWLFITALILLSPTRDLLSSQPRKLGENCEYLAVAGLQCVYSTHVQFEAILALGLPLDIWIYLYRVWDWGGVGGDHHSSEPGHPISSTVGTHHVTPHMVKELPSMIWNHFSSSAPSPPDFVKMSNCNPFKVKILKLSKRQRQRHRQRKRDYAGLESHT